MVMQRSRKWVTAAALAMGLAVTLPRALQAANTTTAPATAPATQARAPQEVLKDLQATGEELNGVLKPLPLMLDEKTRAEVAPKAIPLLKKMLGYVDELSGVGAGPQLDSAKQQLLVIGTLLGDADLEKQLVAQTQSTDADQALQAQLGLAMANWWKNSNNADAQSKILDDVQKLAKTHPAEDDLADALLTMERMGAAKPELAKRAHDIVMKDLSGKAAQRAQAAPTVGEPLAFTAVTVDGDKFDTKSLRGKVVLVDFWATWCGPCIGELPHVKQVYTDYHEKGLEIVGVSCDWDGDKLKSFTKENNMPWVQLWDASRQKERESSWHALATKYGVDGIPTMFLIDRNGVLRHIDARQDLEEKVKALIAEKAATTQPGTRPGTQAAE